MKIPSIKTRFPNKYQHAAQAPALRVTKIQKERDNGRESIWDLYVSLLEFRIWILFGIWRLVFGILLF
jgi:hypothetical protein